MDGNMNLAESCREAWQNLSSFRARRRRLIDFACGRQWGDSCVLPSGRTITEEQQIFDSGRTPVTNNLIRRLIKSIQGRYRYYAVGESAAAEGASEMHRAICGEGCSEAEMRALEEFIVSGCVAMRADAPGGVRNISPTRLFFRRFAEPDASDCRFMGMLHDLSLAEISDRFGTRAEEILAAEDPTADHPAYPEPFAPGADDFDTPDVWGTIRVAEVWQRSMRKVVVITTGQHVERRVVADPWQTIGEMRRKRPRSGPKPRFAIEVCDSWEHTWITTRGVVLSTRVLPPGEMPPLRMMFYPMVDGEIHSLVEEVIPQQKTVNRLIMLLDDVMGAAAKGVVLYPVDQLPDGLTWQDLRRIWSSPNGILPFKRTSRAVVPKQMNSSGSCTGATELLKTQLKLFDEIGGAVAADAAGAATGAEMLRQRRDEATIGVLELLARFRSFVASLT